MSMTTTQVAASRWQPVEGAEDEHRWARVSTCSILPTAKCQRLLLMVVLFLLLKTLHQTETIREALHIF